MIDKKEPIYRIHPNNGVVLCHFDCPHRKQVRMQGVCGTTNMASCDLNPGVVAIDEAMSPDGNRACRDKGYADRVDHAAFVLCAEANPSVEWGNGAIQVILRAMAGRLMGVKK